MIKRKTHKSKIARFCSTKECERTLAPWNKSGLCSACYGRRKDKLIIEKRREEREAEKHV